MRPLAAVLLLALALPTRAADEPTFAGTWDTTYGPMTLVQTGEEIRGTYVMDGLNCQIEGRLEGRKFTFRYQEPGVTGEGSFDLAEDGRSFTGRWRETGGPGRTGRAPESWSRWTGTLLEAPADPFDGVWDSRFGKMRLIQNGDDVRGCYGFNEGEIVGTVKGNRLTFSYTERTEKGIGEFDLSDDRVSITGRWKREGAKAWADWPATRIDPEAGVTWLVVLETQWEEGDLRRSEYAFGDMLRAFFAGSPQIRVRHRIFDETNDLDRWCREASYLPEPVVLLIASHGTPAGVVGENGTVIGASDLAHHLRFADNLRLLHFSACLVLRDHAGEELRDSLGKHETGVSFPISGYTTVVDWAGSAVNEFMYLNLLLNRNLTPQQAFDELTRLLPFSQSEDVPGTSMKALGMRILAE